MEWKEYVDLIISTQTSLDGISLRFGNTETDLSPIVKASILMLEDMIISQGKKNIFVFPDIEQFSHEFLLAKVIYNITAGKIEMLYDPYRFKLGQKLKYMNCIVEFVSCGIDDWDKRERIHFRLKDGNIIGVPVSRAPYFQVVESKRLSTFNAFCKAKKAEASTQNETLRQLRNHMTHLDSSVCYVSEIKSTKEFLSAATLDGKKISDILYLAHVNGDGKLSNLSSGQMTGNPAIIIASDLYSIINAIINDVRIQSVIFDASQPNAIEKQLDAFDELARYDFSIVCITDTANSFDNGPLVDRGYNEWRWDKNSITDSLYYSENKSLGIVRVRNCANQKIKYISVNGPEISEAIQLMYKHKLEIEEQSSMMITVFESLFSLVFTALRNAIPVEPVDSMHFSYILADCREKLEKEKKYITAELYDDIMLIIRDLEIFLSSNYKNKKHQAICDIFNKKEYDSACIIISDRQNKADYKKYWLDWCSENNCNTRISVMYPQEYKASTEQSFNVTLVVGWLSNKIMRNVIYRFDSDEYIILMYQYEERWRKAHTRIWCKKLDSSNNKNIIRKAFSHNKREISTAAFIQNEDINENEEISVTDELADIEQLILTNKYKRYGSSGSSTSEIVDAYPVSFVGGLFAFYRSGHKVVTVTDIIQQTGNQIHSKLPENLDVGDFIVIREAQRDIIRELADYILSKEGKSGLRDIAHKWKESLEVELPYSSIAEIYQKLKDVGCTRDYITVKNWLTNDDLIIPQEHEDLLNIAAVTNDEVLLEKAELIYASGREVRSAHTKAGRILSERLKIKIAEKLQEMSELDPFNFWEPITLQLEDIGNVKVLKIIDVGAMVTVESGNTNRLLSE